MAIRDRFALGTAIPGNAASAGDGGPGFDSSEPSERMSTSVGRESANSDVEIYQRAKQDASGVKPGGSAGFSVGSAHKLVQTTVTGDNNPDSNFGAGGKPVA